ncbi:olfactory receptor 52K2-like [Trichosurus vulpecula]|uniref:olfactory receptor 52K2-like n=1 Tax=Trichosurus vulpecula TaxID=9337 RepID=UPI00186AF21A|nr:olfactory receptor 52K2-like [Trichosurus vulpecula]
MSVMNSTSLHPTSFLLMGIPGLEHLHIWISIPFCSAYTLALLGNCTLLFIIKVDATLHELAMYLFLAMLSAIDLVLSSSTLPKMLALFWLGDHEINFHACLTQMFFLHSFSIMESAILLAMAFDRYMAICEPLHYATVLTQQLIARIGMAAAARAVALMTPLPFLLRSFPYCWGRVITHCYCEHMAVVKLACGNTWFNNVYGIAVALGIGGMDLFFVALSYALILRAVLRLASREARYKAFGTCVSLVGAILAFYTPAVLSSFLHRMARHAAPHVHILAANFYLLFPPMVNPIIYGIKTKQICDRVLGLFQRKNV